MSALKASINKKPGASGLEVGYGELLYRRVVSEKFMLSEH
jgi:hypothetical protein